MNQCAKYAEWISAYVDGMLDEAEQAELLEHLKTCPSCSALFAEYESMSQKLQDMEVEPPVTLAADVMAKIKSQSQQPVLTVKRGGGWRRFIAAAAVFAVLAFVGYQTLWVNVPGGTHEMFATSADVPAPAEPAAAGLESTEAENQMDDMTDADAGRSVTAPEELFEEAYPFDDTGMFGIDGALCVSMTLFERYLNDAYLGDWEILRASLQGAGYAYSMRDGFFFVQDPYSPGSYLYGMLINTLSYPGDTIVTMIGYHLQTEVDSHRVEVRVTGDGAVYYYAVTERNVGGTSAADWEQLRTFLMQG